MKLAEALIKRKDTLKMIDVVNRRMVDMALLDEGQVPEFSHDEMIKELDELYLDLVLLMQTINRTNANVMFDENRTITDALAERDILSYRQKIIMKLLNETSAKRYMYKHVRTYSVRKLAKELDKTAKKFRELDMKIQQKNWATEAME
jgi:hypothetical protein